MDEESFKEWRGRVEKFMVDTNQFLFQGNGKPALVKQIDQIRSDMKAGFAAIHSSNELSAQVALSVANTVKESTDKRWTFVKRVGAIIVITTGLWDLFGPWARSKLHLIPSGQTVNDSLQRTNANGKP